MARTPIQRLRCRGCGNEFINRRRGPHGLVKCMFCPCRENRGDGFELVDKTVVIEPWEEIDPLDDTFDDLTRLNGWK